MYKTRVYVCFQKTNKISFDFELIVQLQTPHFRRNDRLKGIFLQQLYALLSRSIIPSL